MELLNQHNDSNHRSSEVAFTCNAVTCNFTAAKLYSPAGHLTSHETICYQITSGYLQNDSLYFRISYKDTRYDYYYYYILRKYVLLPIAAVVIVGFVIAVVNEKMKLKYFSRVAKFGTCLIVESILTGNLLGGVIWIAMVFPIPALIMDKWGSALIMDRWGKDTRTPSTSPPPSYIGIRKRCLRREEQEHYKLKKNKVKYHLK